MACIRILESQKTKLDFILRDSGGNINVYIKLDMPCRYKQFHGGQLITISGAMLDAWI